jgi:hypothetical protein
VNESSTKSVAFAGGNAALQSPTGTHVLDPTASRVAPVHAEEGITTSHPHPDAFGTKPAGHCAGPTAAQSVFPTTGDVPAAHALAGRTGAQPPGSPSDWNPSGHVADPVPSPPEGAPPPDDEEQPVSENPPKNMDKARLETKKSALRTAPNLAESAAESRLQLNATESSGRG